MITGYYSLRNENYHLADLLFNIFNSDQFENLPKDLKEQITNVINNRS